MHSLSSSPSQFLSSDPAPSRLSHLKQLEAESIHILREAVAESSNPVMLYSIGKDSCVMLHLARKAFFPGPVPFPLLHIDTGWKFREMIAFRDTSLSEAGVNLIVHTNFEAVVEGITPFSGPIYTDLMKTKALKEALTAHGFDLAFGGARRDEEKSRAKERVFSFRSHKHRWDPRDQKPEVWRLYNGLKQPGQSVRVFPLSNWTESDIWHYILAEQIPIVPLYFAASRPMVERDQALIMVDDGRFPLRKGEKPQLKHVRFRTLGCYPLTSAVESMADTLPGIVAEILATRHSERQGRLIDKEGGSSMERKKVEGYF